jgi:RHS repeat-associated protein
VTAVFIQQFEYDQLNRLKRVYDGTNWQQQYVYDRWGNRTVDQVNTWGANIPKPNFGVNANNQLTTPAGYSMTYDQAGNLTNDTYTGQGARTYDAENRMKQAWASGQWQTYAYDGDGRRIKRIVNGIETWQVYGLGGELVAEYAANAAASSPQKEYGYRNGELLITATVTGGWGAPPTMDDNPLNPPNQPKTDIKAIHITQLRTAINALRSHYSLPNYQWQKPTASGGAINNTVLISWEPIDEMRTALDQALGPPSGGYSSGLALGQPILAIHIQELRNRVLEAWQSGGGIDIRWLVSDQLGTPRMIFDQTGSLANVSRHDYLPFGEELFAGAGGRMTAQGYTMSDDVRQKFTQYERDTETGLDYAQARYYANIQGRFTSVDPLMASAKSTNPQTWNRYSYVLNRPTIAIDPDGLSIIVIVVSPRSAGGGGGASIRLKSRTGVEIRDVAGIARGRGQDRTQQYNDTPFGVYRPTANDPHGANANATQGGISGQAARSDNSRFGTGIIYMTPVSGEVVDNNRSTIYIHGGPTLEDHQALGRTDGCVRTENANINTLISDVNDLARNGDPLTNIFVGDAATINAIADQTDQNGDFRYLELRNSGWGTNNTAPHWGDDEEDLALNEQRQH